MKLHLVDIAIIILGLTSLYAIKGGMISVVITEVMQFTILTLTSITIGIIAICKVSPAMIQNAIPAGSFPRKQLLPAQTTTL